MMASEAPVEELRKVYVDGLDKFLDKKGVMRELGKLGINKIVNVKKAPKAYWCVVSFEDIPARDHAIEKLTGHTHKGRTWKARVYDPFEDGKKRERAEGESSEGNNKRQKKEGEQNEEPKTLLDVVTPLHKMTYEESVAWKEDRMGRECCLKAIRQLKKAYKKRDDSLKQAWKTLKRDGSSVDWETFSEGRMEVPDWLGDFRLKHAQPSAPAEDEQAASSEPRFTMKPIKRSPILQGYRNKCEFTIALDPTVGEDAPTTGWQASGVARVGFCLSGMRSDGTRGRMVQSVDDCLNVSDTMKTLVKDLEEFLKDSPFPPHNEQTFTGVWRCLMVRESVRNNETFIGVSVNLEGIDEGGWSVEQQRLKKFFDGKVNSCAIFITNGRLDSTTTTELLFGRDFIEETLFGLKFRVMGDAFFQTNTQGTEVLYSTVIECAKPTDNSIIVDVCCGTGTIGICAAHQTHAKKVIGVELCESAVECAKINATTNGIESTQFVCSKAETVLADLLKAAEKSATGEEIVAIVDPPRSGLHKSCLEALRNCNAIKRLVYVSCNPTGSLVNDLTLLCGPTSKRVQGEPFEPRVASPVDMFPWTDHCEMVLSLERP